MQPVQVCIVPNRKLEDAHENAQWRKAKPMQPIQFENAQWRKVK